MKKSNKDYTKYFQVKVSGVYWNTAPRIGDVVRPLDDKPFHVAHIMHVTRVYTGPDYHYHEKEAWLFDERHDNCETANKCTLIDRKNKPPLG